MWVRPPVLLGVLVLLCFPLSAQSTTAKLSGFVLDENAARIPEAQIVVTNILTNTEQSTTSNADGYFAFPFLPPGRYTLTVQRDGFATLEIKELALALNEQRAIKLQMKVGNLSETVTVESSSVVDSAAVSTLVDRNLAEKLALNGRNFHSLVSVVPGVVLTKTNEFSEGQFSVNGQRADSNNFTVDGVSANFGATGTWNSFGSLPAFSALGGMNNLVSVDALQELSIQTSTYAPEFGRTPGAQVSVVTRAGGNKFHGSVFEYFRNDVLDANDWFGNSFGLPRPQLRQSDFGGVLGGPIFPNRTFFFFSYEGLRLRQPEIISAAVPSTTVRAAAAPPIRALLEATPPANAGESRNFGAFIASYSNPSTLDAISLRVDHKLSNRFSVFSRFNYAPSETLIRTTPSNLTKNVADTKTLTSGVTNSLGAKIQNEFRFNYSTSQRFSSRYLDEFGGAKVPSASQLYPPFISPAEGRFSFNFSGASFRIGDSSSQQTQINFVDNFALLANTHTLKFGVDYRRLYPRMTNTPYTLSINTDRTRAVSGKIRTATISSRIAEVFPRFTNLSLYGQDTWKINPRLTVTYGLRWEVNPKPTEKNGNYPYSVIGWENPPTMTLGPKATSMGETDYGNIAPRFGVAYVLRQAQGYETVVRAGIGVFYDLGLGLESLALNGTGFPHLAVKSLSEVTWPLTPEQASPRPLTLDPPYLNLLIFDPRMKAPRTYEWSGGLEQSMGRDQEFSASYIGAAGRHLKSNQFLSTANPDFLIPQIYRDWSTSDYHALQLQFDRRLSKGVQTLLSYTWSHSIDTASNDFDPSFFGDNERSLSLDRASSDFDVRHSFSAAISYDIPTFVRNNFTKSIFNNWSINTTVLTRTATPLNVRGSFGQFFTRPDLVTGVPLYVVDSNAPGGWYINPRAFTAPPEGQVGTLGRNVLRSFPVFQWDVSLRRTFQITEQTRLLFVADIFNLPNHPNFGDPDAFFFDDPEFDSEFFGRASQMLGQGMQTSFGSGTSGLNPVHQIGGPRSIQFAVKLQF